MRRPAVGKRLLARLGSVLQQTVDDAVPGEHQSRREQGDDDRHHGMDAPTLFPQTLHHGTSPVVTMVVGTERLRSAYEQPSHKPSPLPHKYERLSHVFPGKQAVTAIPVNE